VWPAMAAAYRGTKGDLADRLLAALEAAEKEGGDIRGRQSAAILIVKAHPSGKPWDDKLFDLRVEDAENPIGELRRLVQLQRAYNFMNAGDLAVENGEIEAANKAYTAAAQLAPQIAELPYWQAVTLASKGQVDAALPVFKGVFAREARWIELTPRLVKAGLLPDDPKLMERILQQAPQKSNP
ncbi:MAG: DUF1028 domain-containing protein, partial [Deltaproteobacteria bacterium]|nr:DUF1028 domain-containing protein [Deltaproteobacteria bacterium]